jgi:HK97 family phage portal protein
MGFFDRFFSRKSAGSVIAEVLRGTQTASGAHVNVDSAMRVAAVYACVRVISETIGSLPLHVYQRRNTGGKTIYREHPLYKLLHSQPNSWQTSFEFREMMQAHFELRGNAYAYKSMDQRGNVLELLPLHPDRVEVKQLRDMSLEYHVQLGEGAERVVLRQDQVFHLRGLSSNGYTGRSTLADAREIIGVAIATQEFAGRFYKNDATPSVVLQHPGKLSKEVADRIRDSWNTAFAGSGNARKTAVLEEGMQIERLTLSAEDAQFLETRKFQRSEIAGLFRVPAHLIGDLERATFSNIEAQQIDFVMHCIRPRLVRWEQALMRDLFVKPELYFPEHNVEGLLRGDAKSRFDAYAIGRNWGWLSVNEIRERENLNPIPEGDVYLQPLNMVAAGQPVAVRSSQGDEKKD